MGSSTAHFRHTSNGDGLSAHDRL